MLTKASRQKLPTPADQSNHGRKATNIPTGTSPARRVSHAEDKTLVNPQTCKLFVNLWSAFQGTSFLLDHLMSQRSIHPFRRRLTVVATARVTYV